MCLKTPKISPYNLDIDSFPCATYCAERTHARSTFNGMQLQNGQIQVPLNMVL